MEVKGDTISRDQTSPHQIKRKIHTNIIYRVNISDTTFSNSRKIDLPHAETNTTAFISVQENRTIYRESDLINNIIISFIIV